MKKMTYKYDTHVHTSEGSKCAKAGGTEMARMYKEKGYDGIIITNHFYKGNTAIDRELPWDEWCRQYKNAYEIAKEEGDKIGLQVFYGWEYSANGTDFVTLGLDNDFLLAHEEVKEHSFDINDYCDLVHENGGFIIHAHPFREAVYIPYIRLLPRKVAAVEVVNAGRDDDLNRFALQYAENYSLPFSGGSDAHNVNRTLSGIMTDYKLNSLADIIDAIKNKKITVIEKQKPE